MAYSHQAPHTMSLHRTRRAQPGALAMPRRRGASTGTLLVLLGIWGGIIPFIGPIFGYRMDTAASWTFTWDRLWLNILPGAAAILGGLILLGAANRLSATIGSWIALAGGVWFVVGPTFSLLWNSPVGIDGIGLGSPSQRFIEQIGYFYGLGAVITALAAGALARVLVRSERDVALLETAAEADTVTATETDTATATDAGTVTTRDRYTGETEAVPPASTATERPSAPAARRQEVPPREAPYDAPASDPMAQRGRTVGDERTADPMAERGRTVGGGRTADRRTTDPMADDGTRSDRLSWPEDEDGPDRRR